MERILLFENRDKKADFKKTIENIISGANYLIETFHQNQPFKKIQILADFRALIMDPLGYYDRVVLENIELPRNQQKVNISKLCELYDIPRASFVEILGLYEDNENCKDCHKTRRKGKQESVISYQEFLNYSDYVLFKNGRFEVNLGQVSERIDKFNIYTETQDQYNLYKTWETLFNIISELHKKNLLGPISLNEICRILPGLQTVDYKLYLNTDVITAQILQLK